MRESPDFQKIEGSTWKPSSSPRADGAATSSASRANADLHRTAFLEGLRQQRGGWKLHVHLSLLELRRERRDAELRVGQALASLEIEGLLVQRTGDLRPAILIAHDPAREHLVAHVRAAVLGGVPAVARCH